MTIHTLHREQFVPQPIETVFSFFSRPENLALVTPPWLGFTILTTLPMTMHKGLTIDYSIRLMGLPVRWQTLITRFDPPYEFVDEQRRGPYTLWRHVHTFASINEGTMLTDTLRYALPFGALGNLVHAMIERRQLDEIFDFRSHYIGQHFQTSGKSKEQSECFDS